MLVKCWHGNWSSRSSAVVSCDVSAVQPHQFRQKIFYPATMKREDPVFINQSHRAYNCPSTRKNCSANKWLQIKSLSVLWIVRHFNARWQLTWLILQVFQRCLLESSESRNHPELTTAATYRILALRLIEIISTFVSANLLVLLFLLNQHCFVIGQISSISIWFKSNMRYSSCVNM